MTDTRARTRLGWVVGLTSTAYFMVVLDSVIVITALPRMQRDVHVSLSSLQGPGLRYRQRDRRSSCRAPSSPAGS
jgi:hypothetical protein